MANGPRSLHSPGLSSYGEFVAAAAGGEVVRVGGGVVVTTTASMVGVGAASGSVGGRLTPISGSGLRGRTRFAATSEGFEFVGASRARARAAGAARVRRSNIEKKERRGHESRLGSVKVCRNLK